MNLYLVRNPDGHAVWVAYENAEGQFYSYVQNTGQFHFNGGLYEDFYYDQRMTFEPVTAAAADAAIRAGTGRLDPGTRAHDIARYEADVDGIPVDQILGHRPAPVPSPKQQAIARARTLAAAPAGQWLTWKSYPRDKKQLAHVAVTDITKGKIRALRELGQLKVRLEDVDDQVQVQVSRVA
ncbi:hypothetical protein GCM10023171_36850 [Microbacterium panaciterrae]|uniref:Uncharacterized protein n=1 Tax=Microbacterium panaciterrae TaxID=985759 RepID=A0ABP8PT88_9MICO